MQNVENYRQSFIKYLDQYVQVRNPKSLYEPISYILNLGGKRIRPILTLMTAEIFGQDYEIALDAALSVEVFHNFSLIHDDIMDDAPLRRSQPTVHEKWDLNTGILSGDAMLIMAYQLFEKYEPKVFRNLAKLFSKTAIQVCEGQQYDIDFETRNDVDISDYLKMIEFKTAVLIGAAMKMGAIIAEASEQDQNAIYEFGKNLGIAFQLQDDYLDVFGDAATFGKQVGGDIIENKKTYLYLTALNLSSETDKLELLNLYNSSNNKDAKINSVKNLFLNCGADKATLKEIEKHTHHAFSVLNSLNISDDKKTILKQFGQQLMNRSV
jgi:geranylgeranyl diphosphate synthase type II